MFTFTTFAEESAVEWGAFVEACPEAWLHHRPDFIRGEGRLCSFSARRQGRIVAVCVMAPKRDHLGRVFDGPGIAMDPREDADQLARAIGDELRARARAWGCQAVSFDLPLLAPAHAARSHADSVLAALGCSTGVRPSNLPDYAHSFHSVVDLSQDLAAILKGFSRGNRNSVTRAMKRNFTVTFTCGTRPSEEAWQAFARINRLVFARSGLPGLSEPELEALRDLVGRGFLMLMNILDGEQCVAVELMEVYKGGVNCLAGGSTDEARQFGITPFAMYAAMKWAKEHGCTRFDLGPTIPSLSGTRHGAIGDSKKRFGGTRQGDLTGELILDPAGHFLRIMLPRVLRYALVEVFAPRQLIHTLRTLRGRLHSGKAKAEQAVAVLPKPSPPPGKVQSA